MWQALALLALAGAAPLEAHVIPPGREALVLEMLGGGVDLPGGCRLAGASIDRSVVLARYTCSAGEAAIELRHPDERAAGAIVAGELSVIAKEGAGAELVAAIVDRVRTRSERWSWVELSPGAPDPAMARPSAERPYRGAVIAALIVIPLAGMLLRARRRRLPSSTSSTPDSPSAEQQRS